MAPMNRVLWAVSACMLWATYSCGSSDEHRKSGGEAGAGGNSAGEPGSSAGTPGNDVGGAGASAGEPSSGGSAGEPGSGGSGGSVDSGGAGGIEAAGGAPETAGGQGGAAPVVLPDAIIANVPYTCESPFDGVAFDDYFYLETFEAVDPLAPALSTPGVTASDWQPSTNFPGAEDSVDCDDGLVDAKCTDCNSLWAAGTVTLTFDAQALGALPTHVGMVWTDGGAGTSVTITGYDTENAIIYSQEVPGIGDDSTHGTVEEDRFFGIVHYAGVKRVTLANTGGGIEIDHLQYGR